MNDEYWKWEKKIAGIFLLRGYPAQEGFLLLLALYFAV
jgi:hypothetical protein